MQQCLEDSEYRLGLRSMFFPGPRPQPPRGFLLSSICDCLGVRSLPFPPFGEWEAVA